MNTFNVKTTGYVTGGKYCAGLVGFAKSGNNTIRNCEVAATVTTWGSYCGGILGNAKASTTTITDCLFSGVLNHAPSQTMGYDNSTVTAIGLIYGWGEDPAVHSIVNCMLTGSHTGHANFNMLQKGGGTQSIINCYTADITIKQGSYTTATGNDLVALLGNGWEVRDGKAVPKIITEGINIVPVFNNVTITSAEPADVTSSNVTCHGIYAPYSTGGTDPSMLYLGNDKNLYYPKDNMTFNAFRAYFMLNDLEIPLDVRSYILNLGDETFTGTLGELGITTNLENVQNSKIKDQSQESWYTLDGRKLNGMPKTKGVYIHNGKTVIR